MSWQQLDQIDLDLVSDSLAADGLVYVRKNEGARDLLFSIDGRSPSKLTILDSVRGNLPGMLDLLGRYLLFGRLSDKIVLVDADDPEALRPLTNSTWQAKPRKTTVWDLIAIDNYAYVAGWGEGLRVLEMVNGLPPTRPTATASVTPSPTPSAEPSKTTTPGPTATIQPAGWRLYIPLVMDLDTR